MLRPPEMNIETTPRVSVLIPMYNAESHIISTLYSILQEKDIPIEVVIINDKSTDLSLKKVLGIRDDRIRVIDGPGNGISACMNAGLTLAKGDILMRCDADDQYPAGRIRIQTDWLDANPEYSAVCGGFSAMDDKGGLAVRLATGDAMEEITGELNAGKTRTHLCTFGLRRSVLNSFEGFRSYFVTAEDIDFQLRLAEHGKIMYLPHCFYSYRLHDASITHTQGNIKREFFESTARLFQSQRQVAGQDDLQLGRAPIPPEEAADNPGSAAKQLQGILTGAAWNEHINGNKFNAIALGFRALSQAPFDPKIWRNFVALIVKSVNKITPDQRHE